MTEETNDQPVDTQKSGYFRGRVLRFIGMFFDFRRDCVRGSESE